MNLPFTDVHDLVANLRQQHFPRLHVLPYNRFDVEHSQHWWLSPTAEKAAFRYGKAIFTTDDSWVEEGCVFCGYNVEKGVLHEGNWKRTNVMDDTWFWHRFLDLANVPLQSVVTEAVETLGEKLQIFIACGTLIPGQTWAQLLFDVDGPSLSQVLYRPADGVLANAASSKAFEDLADSLRELDGTPTAWQWVDVLVGHSFELDVNGPDHTDKCAAMIKTFESWMRSGE